MYRKLPFLGVLLGLQLVLAPATRCVAATPITTFGVSAIVQAGCNVSAPPSLGSSAVTMAGVASTLSVNCSNETQYMVAINTGMGLNPAIAGESLFSLPPSSLTRMILPRNPRNSNAAGGPPETGSLPPVISLSDLADASSRAAGADTISVSIIY